MSWSDDFATTLSDCGLDPDQVTELAATAHAEALAASQDPVTFYGPAVLYAREIAAAARVTPRMHPSVRTTQRDVVLRLENLSARRGRRQVLTDVSFTVRQGEVVAVVGANGSGKSTLLDVCAGLLKPSSGKVERVAHFGYAPQLEALGSRLTVDEHLRLFGAAGEMSSAKAISTGHRLFAKLGWRARGNQLVGTLSGGTQQKLNVALAQLDSPDLLLLDEPYQGFDTLAYEDLWTLVGAWRDSGSGVLLVTHLLRDLDLVDRVIELPAPREDAA